MEPEPIRIQRKQTKGWKLPPNTVSVTRPGKWGNPFKPDIITGYTPAKALADYERWINWQSSLNIAFGLPPSLEKIKELRGKNLCCFCPLDQSCHADILLRLANL